MMEVALVKAWIDWIHTPLPLPFLYCKGSQDNDNLTYPKVRENRRGTNNSLHAEDASTFERVIIRDTTVTISCPPSNGSPLSQGLSILY